MLKLEFYIIYELNVVIAEDLGGYRQVRL